MLKDYLEYIESLHKELYMIQYSWKVGDPKAKKMKNNNVEPAVVGLYKIILA